MPRDEREEMRERERDLVLNPRQYAYILDLTKGHINVYVGPHKTSLANTDRPVRFSTATRRFEECRLEDAIQDYPSADEGNYLVLENPANEGEGEHPGAGPNNMARLNHGRKVNIPGPITFPLWPGQIVKAITGHNLRSNQYLVVRVYSEEAARANWSKSVIKPVVPLKEGGGTAAKPEKHAVPPPDLTTGQLLIIKGTEISFYIPPTGIEVVPDENREYVRSAVTLERLEYCILLDEDGNKRYVRGPAVVFPRPTETFVKKSGRSKFRAIDLNELSGIYIKVIAPYQEDSRQYREGEELFITGKDQMIYFPRPEHSLVRYGGQAIHYAVAIPEGEARYVLDKETGRISLVNGPTMFLPDPRKEVVVRRILSERMVELLYPGNKEALDHNRMLSAIAAQQKGSSFITDRTVDAARQAPAAQKADEPLDVAQEQEADVGVLDSDIQRKATYTPPRTITLDTKYDGAVSMNVWTGYAVLLVSRSGKRRVVVGPQTVLLEYDELPQVVELSTGTPKTDKTIRTVYLRAANNKVSDVVEAVTADMVQVAVRVSYRVTFEGDPEKWFAVENYVNFLCDHTRSLIRNAVKQHGIEKFNQGVIHIIRDIILGKPDQSPDGKRPGRKFEENGMRIYDVEILDVRIGDDAIAKMMVTSQHQAVQQAITVAQKERELDIARRQERITQEMASARAETDSRKRALELNGIEEVLKVRLSSLTAEQETTTKQLDGKLAEQKTRDQIQQAELARQRATEELRLNLAARDQEQQLARLTAEAQAMVTRASAISPSLVSALQSFGDKVFVEKLMEALGPHALLRGNTVADVFAQLVNGVPQLAERLTAVVGSLPAATATKPKEG